MRRMPLRNLIATLALIMALGACARVPSDTATLVPAGNIQAANDVWERFAAIATRAENTAGPFRVSGTLFYSGKEDSQRVSIYLWGNGGKASLLPLRLDILMGHGSILGRVREDARMFSVYVPSQETVFTHTGRGGLLAFGVPFPFTLSELTALVTGRYAKTFTTPGVDAVRRIPAAYEGPQSSFFYDIRNAPIAGLLCVSPAGLPLSWQEHNPDGWKLTFEYWEDSTRPTPRKLHIRHSNGGEATLIVREIARPEPFSDEQLALVLPANTRTALLGSPRMPNSKQ